MILYDLPGWIVLSWLFVLGTVIGSFLNVCIHRIPQHESLWGALSGLGHPPSRCPRCGHGILRRDNIPILGWLLLRGRCRNCRAPISMRYPLIELFNGLLFAVVYWYEIPFGYTAKMSDTPLFTPFGLEASTFLSQAAVLHWRYAAHMVMLEALLVASFIDIDTMTIPDASTLPAMAFGLIVGTAVPQIHTVPVWYSSPADVHSYLVLFPNSWRHWLAPDLLSANEAGLAVPAWITQWPHFHGLVVGLAGIVVGGGVVWGVRIIGHWALRREAMGFGDVVLMAMMGSFLGWQPTLVAFFLAPVFALISVALTAAFGFSREIKYGPYLSLGGLATLLAWPIVWPVADRLCQLGPFVPILGLVTAVLLAGCLQLTQGIKWILGIPLYPPDEPSGDWSSADTLFYLSQENPDPRQGRWQTSEWPGVAAGRGTLHEDAWRRGGSTPRAWTNGKHSPP